MPPLTKHPVFLEIKKRAGIKNVSKAISVFAGNHSIPSELAMFAIATIKKIPITREINKNPEIAKQLREFLKTNQVIQPVLQAKKTSARKRKESTYICKYIRFEADDFLVTDDVLKELSHSFEMYQLIYVFENSIREFISNVFLKTYGEDWWIKSHVFDEYREDVKRNMKDEDNPWVDKKIMNPLYYLYLENLSTILSQSKKIFNPYFKDMAKHRDSQWLINIIGDVNKTRRIIAHNNPLTKKMFYRCKNDLEKWFEQIPAIVKILKK